MSGARRWAASPWRRAPPSPPGPTVWRCKACWRIGRQALVQIGFLDPAAPRKLMPRLNQLANRAVLTTEEVHILRGIARAVMEATPPPEPDS